MTFLDSRTAIPCLPSADRWEREPCLTLRSDSKQNIPIGHGSHRQQQHLALTRHEDVWGSGGTAQLFLIFTLMPFYTQGESPRHPLDRRLGRPQRRFGPVWKLWRTEKCFPHRARNFGCPAHSPSLYRMKYPGSY
jgi:hypothetical protein